MKQRAFRDRRPRCRHQGLYFPAGGFDPDAALRLRRGPRCLGFVGDRLDDDLLLLGDHILCDCRVLFDDHIVGVDLQRSVEIAPGPVGGLLLQAAIADVVQGLQRIGLERQCTPIIGPRQIVASKPVISRGDGVQCGNVLAISLQGLLERLQRQSERPGGEMHGAALVGRLVGKCRYVTVDRRDRSGGRGVLGGPDAPRRRQCRQYYADPR